MMQSIALQDDASQGREVDGWTNETLTEEMVEATVLENMEWFMSRNGKELVALFEEVKRLYKEAYHLPKDEIKAGLAMLWAVRDRVAELVGKTAVCSKGCDWCCHMAVGITSIDAEQIQKATGIVPKEINMDYEGLFKNRDAQIRMYMGVKCPFLKDNQCSVYEARPSACRTHFNLSKFKQVCNLGAFRGREVPNLDFSLIWTAEAILVYRMGATMADIRVYFPNVVEGAEVPPDV